MSSEVIDSASVQNFDPNRALGHWYIYATNLNMWKDNLSPTITYSIHETLPDGRVRINDSVTYNTKRPCVGFVPKNIEGIDTQSTHKASRFQWRGNGILKLITSEFGIVSVDNETTHDQPYQWMVTMFDSTLFTSAGVDLMTRTRQPSTNVLNDFIRFCQENPIVRPKSRNMFYTRDHIDDPLSCIKELQIN